ncbi:MAG: DUF1295 domain-containing protein [Gammaproteobacteria bacterium]|nr:DUF1295 domain-containing protein [Gammaproteobacteria bacterium]
MLVLVLGYISCAVVMGMLWLWQRKTQKSSLVDLVWTMCVGAFAITLILVNPLQIFIHHYAVIAILSLWTVRLSLTLYLRYRLLPEDARYEKAKGQWGANAQAKMFAFYQLQAIFVLLFATPFVVFSFDPKLPVRLSIYDVMGIVVAAVSFLGLTISDYQLTLHRKLRLEGVTNERICKSGLWKYSRHPNYFFEWLHWCSYLPLALQFNYGWLYAIHPLTVLYLLLFKTGIPLTERHMVESYGEYYREYQRHTSAFVPWPKKTNI